MFGGSGLWNDDNCAVFQGYVCEKDIDATSVTIYPTPEQIGNCPEGMKLLIVALFHLKDFS